MVVKLFFWLERKRKEKVSERILNILILNWRKQSSSDDGVCFQSKKIKKRWWGLLFSRKFFPLN